jgi:glycosyltransferase involved in cell wall biosynthesis
VIIPAYNAERYVARAIRSALGQTYASLEVVVVDDGSTDATPSIIRSFPDPRVRPLRQVHAGQGAARNHGVRASTGDYVTFLDADDAYLPDKVRRQVEFLQGQPEYRVVFCEALHFYSHRPTTLFMRRRRVRSDAIFRELLRGSLINPNTLMVEGDTLRRGFLFCEERYYPEEWDLCLRLARAGYSFGYQRDALVVVELRKDSNTSLEIQHMLKRHTLEMFERLFQGMSPEERKFYRTDGILRACRLKLAIAALAAPRSGGAPRDAISDLPPWLRYPAAAALTALPAGVVRAAVERLWGWRQRRSLTVVRDPAVAATWARLFAVRQ